MLNFFFIIRSISEINLCRFPVVIFAIFAMMSVGSVCHYICERSTTFLCCMEIKSYTIFMYNQEGEGYNGQREKRTKQTILTDVIVISYWLEYCLRSIYGMLTVKRGD